jgi:hypothetical protein
MGDETGREAGKGRAVQGVPAVGARHCFFFRGARSKTARAVIFFVERKKSGEIPSFPPLDPCCFRHTFFLPGQKERCPLAEVTLPAELRSPVAHRAEAHFPHHAAVALTASVLRCGLDLAAKAPPPRRVTCLCARVFPSSLLCPHPLRLQDYRRIAAADRPTLNACA